MKELIKVVQKAIDEKKGEHPVISVSYTHLDVYKRQA